MFMTKQEQEILDRLSTILKDCEGLLDALVRPIPRETKPQAEKRIA